MILGDMSTGALGFASVLAAIEIISRYTRIAPSWLARGAFALVFLFVAVVMAMGFRSGTPAAFYYDDFFYYLIPARHFLETGSFYFYPGIATNGFQPLWMLVIAALSALSSSHELAFFALMSSTIAALVLLAYRQAYRLMRDNGAPQIFGIYAGLAVIAVQIQIATNGMEVALTLPLLLAFTRAVLAQPLADHSAGSTMRLGFLGSCVALSRLDTLVLLLPMAIMLAVRDRPSLKQIAWIIAGALPLWLYFGINQYLMHTWLPISGQAKMLRDTWHPNLAPFIFTGMLGYSTLAAVAASGLLAWGWKCCNAQRLFVNPISARHKALLASAGIGAVLYYGSYLLLTDWKLWFWYFYPMAWLAALAILGLYWAKCPSWVALVPVFCLYIPVYSVFFRSAQANPIWQKALVLSSIAEHYPGSYAMGDCAGTTAYLMGKPMLQTEGLVGDAAYLNFIRTRAPLASMLTHYGIDYYITSGAQRDADGCFHLREPFMAGPTSKVMRGTVCAEPLAKFGQSSLFRVRDITE